MIKEVEKYNPNGTLNVEYVEQLFDQLLPYEKKSFIENLAPVYGLETRPSEDYLPCDDDSAGGDYRSITDIVSDYDEDDLLREISDSSIFRYLKNEYFDVRSRGRHNAGFEKNPAFCLLKRLTEYDYCVII